MSKTDNLGDFLKDLGDGFRAKKGTTELIPALNFRAELDALKPSNYILPSGSTNITVNGTYDVTNVASAVVNVPIPDGYVKPSGTKTVTANGTYTITNYEKVKVNVPIPSYNTEELTMKNVIYRKDAERFDSKSDAFIYNNKYYYIREGQKEILMYNSETGEFETALSGLTLYNYCRGCSFNGKVYLIQASSGSGTVGLYIYNGSSWSNQSLGFTAYMGNGYVSALGVYNNELYGLFASSASTTSYKLYKYNGSSAWTSIASVTGVSSSSLSNQIRLFECNDYLNIIQGNKHYIYDGSTVTQKSTLPLSSPGTVVGLRNEIHAFFYGNEYVYSFTNSTWTLLKTHSIIDGLGDTQTMYIYNAVNFNNSISCIGFAYNYYYDSDGYETSEAVTYFNRLYWKIYFES